MFGLYWSLLTAYMAVYADLAALHHSTIYIQPPPHLSMVPVQCKAIVVASSVCVHQYYITDITSDLRTLKCLSWAVCQVRAIKYHQMKLPISEAEIIRDILLCARTLFCFRKNWYFQCCLCSVGNGLRRHWLTHVYSQLLMAYIFTLQCIGSVSIFDCWPFIMKLHCIGLLEM